MIDTLLEVATALLAEITVPGVYYDDDCSIDWETTGTQLGGVLSACAQSVDGVFM